MRFKTSCDVSPITFITNCDKVFHLFLVQKLPVFFLRRAGGRLFFIGSALRAPSNVLYVALHALRFKPKILKAQTFALYVSTLSNK